MEAHAYTTPSKAAKRPRPVTPSPKKSPKKFMLKDYPMRSSGTEKKAVDTTISSTFALTNGFGLLNGISLGSDINNRVGRKILIKKVQLSGYIEVAGLANDGNLCRLKLIYDKQTNKAIPLATDILNADDAISFNNLANRERFLTLWEKSYILGVSTTDNSTIAVKESIPVNLETIFNSGNAGTVADIQTGSLYLIYATIGTAANLPGINVNTRVRYLDS